MDDATFWRLIADSRENAGGDPDEQASELTDLLAELPAEEIAAFDRRFRELLVAAYRWDLWGAAFVINGGCSDDGFAYFRCWLVGQGERAYRAALADPETLAEQADPPAEAEGLLYAAADAHEITAGRPLPEVGIADAAEPAGAPWDEDDLPRRFPRLWAAFEQ